MRFQGGRRGGGDNVYLQLLCKKRSSDRVRWWVMLMIKVIGDQNPVVVGRGGSSTSSLFVRRLGVNANHPPQAQALEELVHLCRR